MKTICEWCKAELDDSQGEDKIISYSICEECFTNAFYKKVHLHDFLNTLEEPVFAVNYNVNVETANDKACRMLGKTTAEVEGLLGGDVMECAYSKLPEGCGKTEHCSGCTIRNTVKKTFSTGESQKEIPAYQYIQKPDGPQTMKFLISTKCCPMPTSTRK